MFIRELRDKLRHLRSSAPGMDAFGSFAYRPTAGADRGIQRQRHSRKASWIFLDFPSLTLKFLGDIPFLFDNLNCVDRARLIG